MPGKVNPSMAEMLNQVCFQVLGCDTTITFAAQAGQLELNVMMPVIIHNMLWSLTILSNAMAAFTDPCVRGISANRQRCEDYAFKSASLVTALAPYIGYEESAKIAKEQVGTGRDIREIVRERGLLPEEDLAEILKPEAMTEPGIAGHGRRRRRCSATPARAADAMDAVSGKASALGPRRSCDTIGRGHWLQPVIAPRPLLPRIDG